MQYSEGGWRTLVDGRPLSHREMRMIPTTKHSLLELDAIQNLSYLYGENLAKVGFSERAKLGRIADLIPRIAAFAKMEAIHVDPSDLVEIATQWLLIRELLQKDLKTLRFQVEVAEMERRIFRTLLNAAQRNQEEIEFKMSIQGYSRLVPIYEWRTKAEIKPIHPRKTIGATRAFFENAGAKGLKVSYGDDNRPILTFTISKSAIQFLTELKGEFDRHKMLDPSWSDETRTNSVYFDYYFNVE